MRGVQATSKMLHDLSLFKSYDPGKFVIFESYLSKAHQIKFKLFKCLQIEFWSHTKIVILVDLSLISREFACTPQNDAPRDQKPPLHWPKKSARVSHGKKKNQSPKHLAPPPRRIRIQLQARREEQSSEWHPVSRFDFHPGKRERKPRSTPAPLSRLSLSPHFPTAGGGGVEPNPPAAAAAAALSTDNETVTLGRRAALTACRPHCLPCISRDNALYFPGSPVHRERGGEASKGEITLARARECFTRRPNRLGEVGWNFPEARAGAGWTCVRSRVVRERKGPMAMIRSGKLGRLNASSGKLRGRDYDSRPPPREKSFYSPAGGGGK